MANRITRSSGEWAEHTGQPEGQCPIGQTSYPVMGALDRLGQRIDVAHTCVAIELLPEGRAVPLYGPERIMAAAESRSRKRTRQETESDPVSGPIETAAILAGLKPDVWTTMNALQEKLGVDQGLNESEAFLDQMLWLEANGEVLKRVRANRPEPGDSDQSLTEFKLGPGRQ